MCKFVRVFCVFVWRIGNECVNYSMICVVVNVLCEQDVCFRSLHNCMNVYKSACVCILYLVCKSCW